MDRTRRIPRCTTVYERGGSLSVIRSPAAGAGAGCGTTRRGASNVLKAFKSVPVRVSQARTRFGTTSPLSTVRSRSLDRSRLSTRTAAGHFNYAAQLLIVVAIWIVQLIVSPIWLQSFRFGPAEWLWRTLTYGRVQPMRREAPTLAPLAS